MPYFIYRVFPFRRLEKVTDTPTFGEASAQAKALRASPDRPGDCTIKVIFAADEIEAECKWIMKELGPDGGDADRRWMRQRIG